MIESAQASTGLVRYDDIPKAIALLTTFEDVRQINDQAEALKVLAHRTHDAELMRTAVAYIAHSQRRMGELSLELEKTPGARTDKPVATNGQRSKKVALKGAGIAVRTANRYEKLVALLSEEFDALVQKRCNKALGAALDKGDPFAKQWSGKKEWYTPARYIELAREVMGGIDLDPASCEAAQKIVQAETYFDEQDDGLEQDWLGTVFLNPPYKMPEVDRFIQRLIEHHASGDVGQAILLVNNATDTKWWHAAAGTAAAVCFTLGRISFYDDAGESSSPTNGQCFFYFGSGKSKFAEIFAEVGRVMSCAPIK